MLQLTFVFVALLLLVDCAIYLHPYQEYLNQSIGQADHEAVARKMGAPNRHVALDQGRDIWTYDFCPAGERIGSPTCQNINLVFDKSGKLAEWHVVGEDAKHSRSGR